MVTKEQLERMSYPELLEHIAATVSPEEFQATVAQLIREGKVYKDSDGKLWPTSTKH